MPDQIPQQSKKIFMPVFLSVLGAFSIFMLFVTYGPRKRELFDTMLRPKDPFELYDFSGLTDTGKTLAIAAGVAAFIGIFFMVYNYMNKKKLKESDDIE